MFVNIWLVLRDDAQAAIKQAVDEGEDYTGPVPARVVRIFDRMQDRAVVSRLWRSPTIQSRQYTLWSVYFTESHQTLQKVRDELDWLVATYPNQAAIAGAWLKDGRQAGTTFVYTDVPNPNYNGDTEPETLPNPDYQPDPELEDYDPREELPNPIYDGELIVTETSTTGTPVYPLHPRLLDFMQDLDDQGTRPSNPTDVNLLFGQSPRRFT